MNNSRFHRKVYMITVSVMSHGHMQDGRDA